MAVTSALELGERIASNQQLRNTSDASCSGTPVNSRKSGLDPAIVVTVRCCSRTRDCERFRLAPARRHRWLDGFARACVQRRTCATLRCMRRRITQRELRNESGRIMRALDNGEAFTVTRNGVPVGELVPVRVRVFVPADVVSAAYRRAPRIARTRFRREVDFAINQDPTPRG